MTTPASICIHCGHEKPAALVACPACGFEPKSEDDMARSLMLSPCFDAGGEVIGLAPAELAQAAALIRQGQAYPFDEAAVRRVAAMHAEARSITPRQLAVDLLRWLAPPLLLLAAIWWASMHMW